MIVTAATESSTGVRKMVGSMFDWRVKARWWAAAVLLLAGLFAVAVALAMLTGAAALDPGPWTSLFSLVVFLIVMAFGEETGWRGFALPRLQQGRSPLKATLILSLFWWLWHLPFYWTYPPAVEGAQQIGFLAAFGILQLVVCLTLGTLCAWVYNGSGGNILMAVLLHASWNFWLFGFSGQEASTFALPLFLLAAIVVGIATKGRLGLPTKETTST
jgi:membrane protease YdiL (CAAX protease family)